ncbi:HD-GYP domain-containing protein [Arsukibacterium sp.]|uniref:HD-GYP domain-containing protein n=1 Tax=Arsukibacterium sp. TaxID=1977258 RepID=UPI002FD967C3
MSSESDISDSFTMSAKVMAPTRKDRIKPVSLSKEIHNAQHLYREARELQQRAFQGIAKGNPIDVAEFQRCADGIIDSLFRNQDALLCISRMREKDAYLLEHSVNVAILITIFARYLKLDDATIEQLATGALLHDIGKIQVPNAILNKPGRLTETEFAEMRKHVVYSRDILMKSEGISAVSLDVAANHHERLDGNGYPQGLKDHQISLHARMIAIVDTYDAITATRVYKDGQTGIKALKILRKDSPSHFDSDLVTQFIGAVGMYPPGTLVKLESQKLALVLENNPAKLACPLVKVFYHCKQRHYLNPVTLDLAAKNCNEKIESAVDPAEYNIDINKFFNDFILNA